MSRACLILAMFSLVACGGDDDNPVSSGTDSTCTVGMVLDIGQSCTYD